VLKGTLSGRLNFEKSDTKRKAENVPYRKE
jgi:hypothetical protein